MSLAVGPESQAPSGFDRLPGVTPPSSREPRPGFLTDTIAEMGLTASEHIETAIQESRVRGTPPELILVEERHMSDEDLARARAEHAGLAHVDLSDFDRDRDRDALIGREIAERYLALPIAVMGRCLVVALADPLDGPVIAELVANDKIELVPAVAGATAIKQRLDELPERTPVEIERPVEPPRLQPIEGGAVGNTNPISNGLADRIVERVDAAIDELARSELLKALDDATSEIERLSAELEQSQQRAQALETERDQLRTAADSPADPYRG